MTDTVDNTRKNLIKCNDLLDKECSDDLLRVLIGNKADLTHQRKMLATEGMTLIMENKMHRYFEVSAT